MLVQQRSVVTILRRSVSASMFALVIALSAATMLLSLVPAAHAQTFQVLHNFAGGDDGGEPRTGVVIDRAGNLYGTSWGGTSGYNGHVFKMTHSGSSWTFTPLHEFGGSEGIEPVGITIGPDGNLYGVNLYGGGMGCEGNGCGTVFKVSPPAQSCADLNCPWPATVLYTFGGGSDGSYPWMDGVISDQEGNLYGTTSSSGGGGLGVAYELTHAGGTWTFNLLHTFVGYPGDGGYPTAPLMLDNAGNLYGTTSLGGTANLGTVFQLSPSPSGWNETVLWSFPGTLDGWQPAGGVVFDSAGSLYGTTNRGGNERSSEDCDGIGCGTVFELSPAGGGWTETVLHSFDLSNGDAWPYAGLTPDAAGNFYGTTAGYYPHSNGNVFKLTPSNGSWVYTSVHEFQEYDGMYPASTVAIDEDGNLYGTTTYGGAYGYGVVWELTP